VSFQSLELDAKPNYGFNGVQQQPQNQNSLVVPKDCCQVEAIRNTLNAAVRIPIRWSPIFCNAPTSAVIDYLHCVYQFREDSIVRERRHVGMGVGMHSDVVPECAERSQKQIWIGSNVRADDEVRRRYIFPFKEII